MKADLRASSISSPFGPVLGAYAGQLPTVFEEQFLLPADSTRTIRLVGKMERVWHRPAWLWPFFWLLAQTDVIFPETGTGTDASLTVSAGRDGHGQPYLRWERLFRFKTLRRFNATMLYDRRLKSVVEQMGPSGVLRMVWDVSFSTPDTMRISTAGCVIRLGRGRLWLPRLLCVDVTAVERALESGEGIHILLSVAHPLLGPIFGYSGTFHLLPGSAHSENSRGR